MNRLHVKQKGASAIGLVITLIVIGYGAYVGIQYVPQFIEESTVTSILESLQSDNNTEPFQNADDVKAAWSKHLNVNQMNDLQDKIAVDNYGGKFTIKVNYEIRLLHALCAKPLIALRIVGVAVRDVVTNKRAVERR